MVYAGLHGLGLQYQLHRACVEDSNHLRVVMHIPRASAGCGPDMVSSQ